MTISVNIPNNDPSLGTTYRRARVPMVRVVWFCEAPLGVQPATDATELHLTNGEMIVIDMPFEQFSRLHAEWESKLRDHQKFNQN